MVTRPFPVRQHHTAIAIAYRNQEMIADQVLPRINVNSERFTWMEYDTAERFTVPETRVGRTSRPTQLEFSAQEREARTLDYALDVPIPNSDISEAPEGHDPEGQAVQYAADILELDREVRVANTVFDIDAYPTGNKETLSGSDQWQDSASDPKTQLMDALDTPLVRPDVLLLGQRPWSVLRQNPTIVKAVHGNSGDTGVVTRQQVADLLEISEIIVGNAFVNIQRPGQNPEMARVWGKNALLFHRNRLANNRQGLTFGYTAQRGGRFGGSQSDPDIGAEGGVRVRAGEKVKEVIAAPAAAYYFEQVVA